MAARKRTLTSGPSMVMALLLAVVLIACGGDTVDPPDDPGTDPGTEDPTDAPEPDEVEELYAAAQAEGGITFYSSQNPELIETIIEGFEEAYPGVSVDFLRLASGALATRFAEEQNAGVCEADVMLIADPAYLSQGEQDGWWASLDAVPAAADFPSDFIMFNRTSAKVTIIPTGIAYNTDLVSDADAPERWEDILDDRFANDLVLVDPSATPGWMALYRIWMEEFGPEFLEGLAAQGFTVADSSVPGAQLVAAGEGAILVPTIESVQAGLIADGAPIATNLVLEGPTTGIEQFINVTSCTDRPNGANLFAHYLMTEEGQTLLNEGFAASPLGELPGTLPLPADYRDPAITELTPEVSDQILSLLGLQ